MPYVIGVCLAAFVWLLARVVGLDRDRAFYPTVMIVIASLYVLFAAIGASTPTTLAVECVIAVGFCAVAIAGFKRSLWLVVAALAGHGIFDSFHGHVIANPGVPVWWPQFCLAYDVVAAIGLAVLLRSKRDAVPSSGPERVA
jgi:hypothetical protein